LNCVDLIVPQAPRLWKNVAVKQKDIDVKFELGFVEAGGGKLVQITPSTAARRATYEIGTRRVTVTGGEEGPHPVTVTVRLGATTVVN